MQIEIQIDSSCTEPKIIIVTDKMTDAVHDIVKNLSEKTPEVLCGFYDNTAQILELSNIIRIYAVAGKVVAVNNSKEYVLRMRLYELEERLSQNSFIRISNSEIINLRMVKNFDLSFAGTICVTLSDGTITYVSRRYMGKIKQALGI